MAPGGFFCVFRSLFSIWFFLSKQEAKFRESVFNPQVGKEFQGIRVGILGLISDRFSLALPAESTV